MNLSKSIRLAIIYRDTTVEDLAHSLNRSAAYIYKYINQDTDPRLSKIIDMAEALDYKLSEFIALGEK